MSFIKHVGKHADRKVAILYRTVPGEEHMALVIYPDTLSTIFHDAVIKVIESKEGQDSLSLADAMHRALTSDGRQLLQTLHQEGKIKKIQTNQIVVTPNATSHVRLDELNKIFDGMEAGNEAATAMADIEAVDPIEQQANDALVAEAGSDVMGDDELGQQMFNQATQMGLEGESLVNESKRLLKDAYKLNPALKPKPKRAVKKKAAPKKA